MKLVYQGPEPLLQLNIADKVIYYRGVPFEAEGGYAECLLSKLHPHRFAVVDEPVSEATAISPTTKRVGRKPKEQ